MVVRVSFDLLVRKGVGQLVRLVDNPTPTGVTWFNCSQYTLTYLIFVVRKQLHVSRVYSLGVGGSKGPCLGEVSRHKKRSFLILPILHGDWFFKFTLL